MSLADRRFTDAWTGYHHIARHRFSHVLTHVGTSGDPADVALAHVHRVASLKRWLLGTHQGAVTDGQLDYYLDEFTFRFDHRRSRHRGLLFYRLIEGVLTAPPAPTGRSSPPCSMPATIYLQNSADG